MIENDFAVRIKQAEISTSNSALVMLVIQNLSRESGLPVDALQYRLCPYCSANCAGYKSLWQSRLKADIPRVLFQDESDKSRGVGRIIINAGNTTVDQIADQLRRLECGNSSENGTRTVERAIRILEVST